MYANIPEELKATTRWVCWKAVNDQLRLGKIKKIPINPNTGGQAQSNNPDTWSDFQTAVEVSKAFSGIGFMLGGGYFGVDIDNVESDIIDYMNGGYNNIVAEFIHSLRCYSEYSVSGKGIHIISRGALPPNGRRKNNIEMYDSGRFFVMTGNVASEYTEILDRTTIIEILHEKYIGDVKEKAIEQVVPKSQIDMTEQQIIDLAMNSRQGQNFSDLYDGEWEKNFTSHSEADMSFCSMLAFWCRCDKKLMDRIFRSSGLMRTKWDRKQRGSTYGNITINKAIAQCKNVYEPRGPYSIKIGLENRIPNPMICTLDDMGNAERFVHRFGNIVRYSYVNKSFMYYDGTRWCEDNMGKVIGMFDQVINDMRKNLDAYIQCSGEGADAKEMEKQFLKHCKKSRSNKAKVAMINETKHRLSILPDQLDRDKILLNTLNGTILLSIGKIYTHKPDRYITKITTTEYIDEGNCPKWQNFLRDIFRNDQELIKYVQKAVGYSLSGLTKEQCVFFCYGIGRNGKSTFLDVISDILGDYATNIQPETLMVRNQMGGANSDIARLKGARFVTTVEPNDGMRLNEGLIKQLSGGDKVTARRLYGNEFEFTPEFKLWMATNHKPIIRGTDLGIWRRIHLIPFTVQIPEEGVDTDLKAKLEEEYPAILKWAVDGYLLWQREGLNQPAAVKQATAEYRNEMDVISAFIKNCIMVGDGDEQASDLYKAYVTWAKENNEYEMRNTKFGMEMSKRFEKVRKNNGIYYKGLKILNQYAPYNITFLSSQ